MLTDHEIEALCRGDRPMIAPYAPAQINPNSYNICLGPRLLLERHLPLDLRGEQVAASTRWEQRRWEEIDIGRCTKEQPHWLRPDEFYLGHTCEQLALPVDIAATFYLRSSRAREGYGHSLAGHIDAGFHGVLTLELHAHTVHTPLPLYPGLSIGQLVFHRLAAAPHFSYAEVGRYHNDRSVQVSKG